MINEIDEYAFIERVNLRDVSRWYFFSYIFIDFEKN